MSCSCCDPPFDPATKVHIGIYVPTSEWAGEYFDWKKIQSMQDYIKLADEQLAKIRKERDRQDKTIAKLQKKLGITPKVVDDAF